MKAFYFVAALSALTVNAAAADYAAYGSLGTQGVGAGIVLPISPTTAARFEINSINVSSDFNESDVNYTAKVKNNSASALFDWHFAGGAPWLRATAGLVFNDGGFSGTGTPTTPGSYTFNGTTYTVGTSESVTVDGEFRKVAPYLGIGFGRPVTTKGWGVFGDIGAFYAKPKMNVTLSPGLAAVVSATDLATETANLQEDADELKWYPVLRVGVRYAF